MAPQEPGLLPTWMPVALDFAVDPQADARRLTAQFMEDAVKVNGSRTLEPPSQTLPLADRAEAHARRALRCADAVLPATLLPLHRLLTDSNAAVLKRAILTASALFGLAFATM